MSSLYFIVQETMFFAIPLLVVAMGAMFSEKSGVTNIALESIMIIGAFCGIITMNFLGTIMSGQFVLIISMAVAALAGMAFSKLHAYSAIRLQADQTISGTALNLFAPALCIFLARTSYGSKNVNFADTYHIDKVSGLGDIPVIGPMFFTNCYITTFIGIACFAVLAFIIRKTRFGMRLSACGENPEAAASAGINVSTMRNAGVLISGVMGGLGGMVFVIPTSTSFSANVAGYGFLALAVLILGQWKSKGILPAAFFFGILKAISSAYSGMPILSHLEIASEFYKLIPYVLTLVVLAMSSKKSRAPKAIGKPYDDGSSKSIKKAGKGRKIKIAVIAAVIVVVSGGIAVNSAVTESSTGVSRGYGGEIAQIVDYASSIDDKSFHQGTWEGVLAYSSKDGTTHKYYQCNDNSKGAIQENVRIAVRGGAKIILLAGPENNVAIYEVQKKYPNVNFILVDCIPTSADGTVTEVADNTLSIAFAENESGFLAGYAAVMDGYRSLGFMGGKAVPAVVRYGYGFACGAEQAAEDLGLAEGAVKLKYNYTGTFVSNPESLSQASSWYNTGTEVIFACGGSMGNSVMKAAENTGGKVIGVDVDQSVESESVITSAMKDISEAVRSSIEKVVDSEGKIGVIEEMGTENGAVALPMKTSKFNKFTQEQYDDIYERLASGSIEIADDKTANRADEIGLKHVDVNVVK